MNQPAALFVDQPAPDSAARRRFRALARSAPWLSTSLHLELQVPAELADASRGLSGTLQMIIRQREAIAIRNSSGDLIYQREHFTVDRGRDYVAATASSWELPATLATPVFTKDHLVLRRPEIAGFGDLLPLDFLSVMLDPFELAGAEPASLELAFDHPTFIHELAETTFSGRPVLAAVLSAGHTYRPTLPDFTLVPPNSYMLIMLDLATGVCVHRRDLSGQHPEISLRILAQNQYYIDSLFTEPAPTLTDVRAPIQWEIRGEQGR